jgi:GTPase Era involved in 16S rRNA processing
MTNVEITYNPYKVKSKILVDGEEPKQNSRLSQFLNKRFQLWVDQIPYLLSNEYNDDEFDLTFLGTELDYQDLLAAIESAQKDGIQFIAKKLPAKEFGDKEKDIRKLFSKIKELPFEELQSPAVANAFELAFNELLEVNVVATMSAGKSTLINALLGKQLMPIKAGACTAKITRIQDDDDSTYKAVTIDQNKTELEHYSSIDYETMKALNKNPDVSEIQVRGNIPFVTADEASLVLIDTPGPDNARDPRHRKIAAKALDQSSKMLVMFVMNGGKLHDEAQDAFLRRIAKSMSVGGKQSKERFLFVINKIDDYEENNDDISGETIPDTVKYLEEMGIEDPNIFLAAAKPALLIRCYQNTLDEEEKKKLLDQITPVAKKLIKQKQLHLEQYPRLSRSCQMTIDKELEKAIESNDVLGQALVHSGIRGIEETIRMYVTKYCRPAKITNVVNTFLGGLESAEAFTKTKEEISSHEDELTELGKEMESLNKKIDSREENEKFKKRLRKLDVKSQLTERLDDLISEVQRELRLFFFDCPVEMEEEDATSYIRKFETLANSKQSEFQITVENLIDSDIKAKSDQLLTEYIKKLDAISEEFNGKGLKINLGSYIKGELALLSSDSAIDASIDSRIETHTEERFKEVTHRRRGWDRLFHPSNWFDPYYKTTEYYDVEIKEEIKFVSREKLSNQMVAPVKEKLLEERARVLKYASNETQRVIEYFEAQFDKVDKILADKTEELRKVTISKENAQNALMEARKLIETLEGIRTELNETLEI